MKRGQFGVSAQSFQMWTKEATQLCENVSNLCSSTDEEVLSMLRSHGSGRGKANRVHLHPEQRLLQANLS